MYKFRNDKYKKSRGGKSVVLDVKCGKCDSHIAYYQKDGPGMLKRMYLDRFIDLSPEGSELNCISCDDVVGSLMVYKKESRKAYRLFAGAVTKKVVSSRIVN